MASDIIIKTRDGQVIPAIQPDAFGLAVQSMEKLNEEMGQLVVRARDIPKVIDDKPTYDKAAAIVAQKKSIVKLSDSTMIPFEEAVKAVKGFIQTQKNVVKNHGEQVGMLVEPQMAEWNEREARAAKADEERRQAEKKAQLQREAEEKAQKDAEAATERKRLRITQINADFKAGKITKRQKEKFLREAGDTAAADLAKIEADEEDAKFRATEEAQKLKVKPRTGAVGGITRRTNYYAECIDQDMFKAALMIAWEKKDFQAHERLMGVMVVSKEKLCEKAREIEDDAKMEELYPFVKATHNNTF